MENTYSFGYNAWFQPYVGEYDFEISGHDCLALDECRKIFVHSKNNAKNGKNIEVILKIDLSLIEESFAISNIDNKIQISASTDIGLLYGVYCLYRNIKQGKILQNFTSAPLVASRILNHWDNGDGSVERGYAGNSLFWKNGKFGYDLDRLRDYARILASVGINQISINNVNVRQLTARLLTDECLPDLAKVAAVFRPFGIKLIIAVHFDSPVWLGGLSTSDPVDPKVAEFWKAVAAKVYSTVPDLGGFLVKADSEFNLGPLAFGHTQDVGANVIAKALAPFGGTLHWRCFVYNCLQDWRDTTTDRPKAAYDTFFPIDGKFDKNVTLQIKHGPSDFQVREPNSPLLGAMKHTSQSIEFQIAQEYTGHQKDLYAWAVQWEEIFEQPFNQHRKMRDLVGNDKEIIAVVAVSNTGNNDNWCGNIMAQANLYAFGRMAWDANLTAEEVSSEWVALTFGTSHEVHIPITKMLLNSRHTYEKYNAPLGIGWMVNINHHYGPSVDGYEYMKWGTYHRANATAIGVDRTSRGTGFTTQYQPYVCSLYENLDTCPEEMVLFFHRLEYTHVLKSGKTLLQHIYDTHFEGVEEVEAFINTWISLQGLVPNDAHESIRVCLDMQLANAKEWRDVINSYFFRKTGMPDALGRKIYE